MQEIELKKVEMDFHVREAYKTLRSNIEFSGEDVRLVAVTSCAPNEGKSSTSYHLARAFAENGSRVLLIDADLRKSVMRGLHKRGRVRLGLVHALVGKSTFDDIDGIQDYIDKNCPYRIEITNFSSEWVKFKVVPK